MGRIWIDGCFDLFHHGHANAIRQAAAFGPLTVGVHSDEAIEANKGPPVLTLDERIRLVAACRWVGGEEAVVGGAPYVTDVQYVQKYGIDYVVHGDDVTTDVDGNDTYRYVKEAGMYKECKRTEGVSTTDAIGRVLTGSNVNPDAPMSNDVYADLLLAFCTVPGDQRKKRLVSWSAADPPTSYASLFTRDSAADPATYLACVSPLPYGPEHIIYVSGPFDGFLPKHVDRLAALAAEGLYVIVGVATSETILERTGRPAIFSLQERTLSVLQCKHVSAVISPAPPAAFLASLYSRDVQLPIESSPLYDRIEARKSALEARQARKLGKSQVEAGLRSNVS